ncbi:MAG: hypothetical protein ABIZ49_00225, partial [Opitutaceae bacterium]
VLHMKTLLALASIAASVAFVLFQFSFEISVSLLFAAGFAAIVISDYTRPVRSLVAAPAAEAVALRRKERFGLAA